jgi:hypothetical protein
MRIILEAPEYVGILRAIRPVPADDWDSPAEDEPGQDEIDGDIEGERETLAFDDPLDLVPSDDDDDAEDDESDSAEEDLDGDTKMNDLRAVIQEASKGVVESTDVEYRRY